MLNAAGAPVATAATTTAAKCSLDLGVDRVVVCLNPRAVELSVVARRGRAVRPTQDAKRMPCDTDFGPARAVGAGRVKHCTLAPTPASLTLSSL
jgi:hypothetical protein